MIYVPIQKKCTTDFRNFAFEIFSKFLKVYIVQQIFEILLLKFLANFLKFTSAAEPSRLIGLI